ncbi:porin [Paracoccus tibetensis]|uniref:Outer membrane protein OmpU n=1 Tax=Paracoccus tibetensis TaxID=336292 RepID=A0A1G5E3G9_9RHOB|nr:porin [Paracoccus tibetensis]SCY21563.1 outer membrane protein OmpU [Paracoccus tibetensis]
MKKALIASTALVLSAGVAAADVTVSGYGRTGIIYYEDNAGLPGNDTQVISRLRMNLDATTSTDAGVDFGGRVRLQWDQNNATRGEQATLNAGKLFVTASGLTVEVGNVDTAFDGAGLLYAEELGSYDRSVGVRRGSFFSYNTGPNPSATYQGLAVRYSIEGLTARLSYVDPDQTGLVADDEELSLSVDYTWNDALELSGAYVTNGAGIDGNDAFFLGARYAVAENARVGLNYLDSDLDAAGRTVWLYGDYTLADGATNFEAYIANNNSDLNETDNAFGIGVNYDLGGARLGASIHRDNAERVTADAGVRFNF